MAVDALTPAVLDYIEHGNFPQDEDIASADLSSDKLGHIGAALRKEQEEVQNEIRGLSQSTAGDVDTWIAKAKELQADILRSRETARQIVAQHEQTKSFATKVKEAGQYFTELQHETNVYSSIAAKLQAIKRVKVLLDSVQDALVSGEVDAGLARLQEAEEEVSVNDLGEARSGVGHMLRRRIERLNENLRTTVHERWSDGVSVSIEERRVVISNGLGSVINAARGLGVFDDLVGKLAKDVEKAVFRPRLAPARDGQVFIFAIDGTQLTCNGKGDDTSVEALFEDLQSSFNFLAQHLEQDIVSPLAEIIVPRINVRLEEDWLEAAVPVDIEDLPGFETLLERTSGFADQIDQLGWHGSKSLREWVQSAPKTWLTKRREAILGDVRNLVFSGLRERKTVERVETQTISKEDHAALGGADGADDEWDAWGEQEGSVGSPTTAAPPKQADDEDMSAWDEDVDVPTQPSNAGASASQPEDEDMSAWDEPDTTAQPPSGEAGDDEGEAWGWDGEDEQPASGAPQAKASTGPNGVNTSSKVADREMTLRETFTVTGIPDGTLELLKQIISDAQSLAGSESPFAAAAAGLYSLPTLGLAIYRATAPTAYAKIDVGNMLIYNDALHLAAQLRAWQADQPPASRLRVDGDVKSLEQFAKRAYSSEMESQRTILSDLLDGAQGFSACSEQPAKQECEDAVEQAVLRLRDVHRLWSPILSTSALLQSVGSLLSSIAQKMIREIEDLPDIGEADSKQLKILIDQASTAKDLFVQNDRDMTFVYCPNWLKFQYMAEIMESSLADIKYMWKESELSMEYTAEEVVGLIEALFAESIHRRQAIQDIRR
ncbi:hypothetical protein CB0940_10983 [Cercospora beticola]|uniref:Centromere/kinetochore protein zw10 n=1 Tax=Cercospora beticola TaxID=122368 RepID=A0A2G5HDQ6_CERBT|nr:hypothetical protein CB0940_10983 [Cercospora beticola]PIA90680.1 hypothetical protein CB0940_10983 [Cercospora beticola]WPB07806.1 hypothetical protein RHO25_012470 [Cercospora beticola]